MKCYHGHFNNSKCEFLKTLWIILENLVSPNLSPLSFFRRNKNKNEQVKVGTNKITQNLLIFFTLFVNIQLYEWSLLLFSDISNSISTLSFLNASQDIEKVFKGEIFCQRFPRGDVR